MKSIAKQTEVNESRIVTVIGPNKVCKDLIEVSVYDDAGNHYTVGELFDTILQLKSELKSLKQRIERDEKAQNNVDSTITEALDLLSLKMSQVEVSIRELENKTKLL